MSRQSVKQSLQTVLQSVPGIKTVYTYLPRNQQGMIFPSIVITLEKTNEKVVTMGNPGRRHIDFTVKLYIQSVDPNPVESTSQANFDILLDSIDTTLRSNKDLNGTVLKSAWEYIDTDVFTPQLAGQGAAILMRAIKTFDVTIEITG